MTWTFSPNRPARANEREDLPVPRIENQCESLANRMGCQAVPGGPWNK